MLGGERDKRCRCLVEVVQLCQRGGNSWVGGLFGELTTGSGCTRVCQEVKVGVSMRGEWRNFGDRVGERLASFGDIRGI